MLRKGFTSGSCAAAAAAAACRMLLSGIRLDSITIDTPAGIPYHAELLDVSMEKDRVSCGVRKDGGDDPDVTTGLIIYACVERIKEKTQSDAADVKQIYLQAGEGIGRVTAPGLDQPVGSPAINRVPRRMIMDEVRSTVELFDEEGPLSVTISAPGGEKLAEKTFNERLGIVGGISILGTTGIVNPMSEEALLATIRLELRQRRLAGQDTVVVTPGNYGMEMLKKTFDYDLEKAVRCSNFIGDTIDMAAGEGFHRMVLIGHMGKLVKCAGGAMNTHSRYGDGRMEILAAEAYRQGADIMSVRRILSSVSVDAALSVLDEAGSDPPLRIGVCNEVLNRALRNLRNKAGAGPGIEMMIYTNEHGILAESPDAREWLLSTDS